VLARSAFRRRVWSIPTSSAFNAAQTWHDLAWQFESAVTDNWSASSGIRAGCEARPGFTRAPHPPTRSPSPHWSQLSSLGAKYGDSRARCRSKTAFEKRRGRGAPRDTVDQSVAGAGRPAPCTLACRPSAESVRKAGHRPARTLRQALGAARFRAVILRATRPAAREWGHVRRARSPARPVTSTTSLSPNCWRPGATVLR